MARTVASSRGERTAYPPGAARISRGADACRTANSLRALAPHRNHSIGIGFINSTTDAAAGMARFAAPSPNHANTSRTSPDAMVWSPSNSQ